MLIKFILYINKKFFFRKKHPFNESKNWVLDINYSDFEYDHAGELLSMYNEIFNLDNLKNKTILEVWCWGWWKSVYIAEKYNSNVVWIDLNDTFLNQANKKALDKNIWDKVSFYKEDALNTSFNNDKFDIIILSDVIEHIPNTQKMLEECYRILKKWWYIIFDFAPYYHYFGHHLWDTIQIPWLHVFTTESFRIKLYKESVRLKTDWDKRIDLRIWKKWKKESFTYLNKITRREFENIINKLCEEKQCNLTIKYHMLKKLNFLSNIPFFRELFIRHIIGCVKK